MYSRAILSITYISVVDTKMSKYPSRYIFFAIEGFESCEKVKTVRKIVVLGATTGMGRGWSVTANHALGCTRTNACIVYVCLARGASVP
jgi:hypothetical protein